MNVSGRIILSKYCRLETSNLKMTHAPVSGVVTILSQRRLSEIIIFYLQSRKASESSCGHSLLISLKTQLFFPLFSITVIYLQHTVFYIKLMPILSTTRSIISKLLSTQFHSCGVIGQCVVTDPCHYQKVHLLLMDWDCLMLIIFGSF